MSTAGRNRRIEPVSPELSLHELEDRRRWARPGLATWLLVGPALGALGLVGLLRLVGGVATPTAVFSWLDLGLDLLLLIAFLLPWELLARGAGRRLLNRPAGPEAEQPLYVLICSLSLLLLVSCWRTTGAVLWDREGVWLLLSRFTQGLGLLWSFWAVLVTGLFFSLGLVHLRAMESGKSAPTAEFVALPPYRWSRQPMNLGFLLLLLAMPEVTPDRLLLMCGTLVWTLLAAPHQERDAELCFGRAYADFKERTPRWLPNFRLRG